MIFWKHCLLAFIGLSSGAMVAAGIFAFIAAIGIVPRLAQRTGTFQYIPLYEDAIVIGGIFGTTTMFIDYYIPLGSIIVILLALCSGIFVGCLAIALAEVLNVMPIFLRRSKLTRGIPIMIVGVALGKMLGSMLYFFVKGFYVM